ncbi:hypothetical protein TI03_05885 [Achromatium sp. WMS1]|nr:hypothetical protein TI03_05885 [Achromatium sp. WMS1]
MGYRGKKAAQFKEAYINRFNEMEQQLTTNTSQISTNKTTQDLKSQDVTDPILNKPHMIMIQDINFLTYIETRQIRKNLEGEVKYYTKAETGESGINFQSLANACGGVSAKTLNDVLSKYADPYLTEDIVKDQICEQVIHYFAFESPQKKTKAKELHRDFAYFRCKSGS